MTLAKDANTGVLTITGTLDIVDANALREALLDCLLHQPEIVVDLSSVHALDTAALQVLLAGRKNAVSTGKAFRLIETPACVSEMAASLGLSLGMGEEASLEGSAHAL